MTRPDPQDADLSVRVDVREGAALAVRQRLRLVPERLPDVVEQPRAVRGPGVRPAPQFAVDRVQCLLGAAQEDRALAEGGGLARSCSSSAAVRSDGSSDGRSSTYAGIRRPSWNRTGVRRLGGGAMAGSRRGASGDGGGGGGGAVVVVTVVTVAVVETGSVDGVTPGTGVVVSVGPAARVVPGVLVEVWGAGRTTDQSRSH
ncbi:hypothetical protein L1856_06730 [Streptomyces sp. Tue 6430]|nr:hypothetical protein [Streptomyces sp. Tue 6430]